MARDINDIERDLERTRRQLASTLDKLAERTSPQNLVDEAKTTAANKLSDPTVQKIIAGAVGVVALVVIIGVSRSRRNRRDLKNIQRLLAERG